MPWVTAAGHQAPSVDVLPWQPTPVSVITSANQLQLHTSFPAIIMLGTMETQLYTNIWAFSLVLDWLNFSIWDVKVYPANAKVTLLF